MLKFHVTEQMGTAMSTDALVKIDAAVRHDELIQLVSFNLDNERVRGEVLKVREIQACVEV